MKLTEEYIAVNGIWEYLLHIPAEQPEAGEKPVILFLHGGPGQSEAIMAYAVEADNGGAYTMVHYDQRGAGKTYLKNKEAQPTVKLLMEDLLQTVLYVKKKYKKEKLILLGHSWGTAIGSIFAMRHPEHVLCYIGVGQFINCRENEQLGFEKLKEAVRESGNQTDQKKLQAIQPYPPEHYSKTTWNLMGQVRKLQGKYNLAMKMDAKLLKMVWKSPNFSMSDVRAMLASSRINIKLMEWMWEYDLKMYGMEYQVPVYYLLGEKDNQTPAEIAVHYLEEVKAPDKKLFLVKNAGHMTMIDNKTGYRKGLQGILSRVKKFH